LKVAVQAMASGVSMCVANPYGGQQALKGAFTDVLTKPFSTSCQPHRGQQALKVGASAPLKAISNNVANPFRSAGMALGPYSIPSSGCQPLVDQQALKVSQRRLPLGFWPVANPYGVSRH